MGPWPSQAQMGYSQRRHGEIPQEQAHSRGWAGPWALGPARLAHGLAHQPASPAHGLAHQLMGLLMRDPWAGPSAAWSSS